nr:CsiV family protein [Stutzerimonas stutzeri]
MLLLLALCTPPAFAEALYRVEVLLFRHDAPLQASQRAPVDWAKGAHMLERSAERQPVLEAVAERLSAEPGYQLLLHRAWRQPITDNSKAIALHQGQRHFEHYPIQGVLQLRPGRYMQTDVTFWINRFGDYGQLLASERLTQRVRLVPGRLTYIDHDSLGLLIELKRL